jgi:hypothetical protein
MTKDQAEAIYILTYSQHWEKFIEYQQQQLGILHDKLEWARGEDFLTAQGQCKEIKNILNLRNMALNLLDNS